MALSDGELAIELSDRKRGGIASESSKVELEENKEPKRLALSEGELAIELSVRKRGGKEDLQKLVEILLARDQKDLVEVELIRPLHFLLMKERLALRRTDLA